MNIDIIKTFFIIITSVYLSSCSNGNKSIDTDLSNLPKPKQLVKTKETAEDIKNYPTVK